MKLFALAAALGTMAVSGAAWAQEEPLFTKAEILGVPYEMLIFAVMLTCLAIFYTKTRQVAVLGLLALCFYKYEFTDGFSVLHQLFGYTRPDGTVTHGTWRTYLNLGLMLPGFAVLAKIFEDSGFPSFIPRYLPRGRAGGMLLLFFVFVLSGFLDNIAAAMIGCAIAATIYQGKVHIGYVAAICAASNAGGAGSVVGDTTTTLIWIFGKDPLVLAQAYLPAFTAFLMLAFFGASQQQKYAPMEDLAVAAQATIDKNKLVSVLLILIGAIFFNYMYELPAAGIWIAIIISMFITKVDLKAALESFDSTVFLVALVFCAELVPVESVPDASILSTMAIGFVSSVFNNIPLTQLCLIKGGYDWPLISYAVGFGGSMVWFGSSAGVAVCDKFPKARSFMNWLRYGWHIPFAFVLGFGVYLLVLGWDPMKGNPPDQMPEPISYSEAIGNAPVHELPAAPQK